MTNYVHQIGLQPLIGKPMPKNDPDCYDSSVWRNEYQDEDGNTVKYLNFHQGDWGESYAVTYDKDGKAISQEITDCQPVYYDKESGNYVKFDLEFFEGHENEYSEIYKSWYDYDMDGLVDEYKTYVQDSDDENLYECSETINKDGYTKSLTTKKRDESMSETKTFRNGILASQERETLINRNDGLYLVETDSDGDGIFESMKEIQK